MGNKRNRRVRPTTSKAPTPTQKNQALREEVEKLINERDRLLVRLKAADDPSISTETATALTEGELLKRFSLDVCEDAINRLNKMIMPVLETQKETMSVMKEQLAQERVAFDNLKSTIKEVHRIEPTCLVCLNETGSYLSHLTVALPCGHLYGSPCISKWIEEHKQCPQCRNVCEPSDVRPIFINQIIEFNRASKTWETVIFSRPCSRYY